VTFEVVIIIIIIIKLTNMPYVTVSDKMTLQKKALHC